MDKKDEEQHSMSKPKPLEEVSDGDLSEIKKDPIWKTWLEKKEDPKTPTPEEHEPTPVEEAEQEAEEQTETVVGGAVLNNALHLIGLSYKSWLENKDAQTGQQSYLGKPKEEGRSHGEQSTYVKLLGDSDNDPHRRVPDKYTKPRRGGVLGRYGGAPTEDDKIHWYTNAENRGQDYSGKKQQSSGSGSPKIKAWEVWLEKGKKKQTRIDRHGEWFDPSKIGTNTGWEDDPMNKPSYFQARMREEEERKKKEKKKAKNRRPPIKDNSSYLQGPKKMEVTSPHRKGQKRGGEETGEEWQKYWNEHKDKLLSHEEKKKKAKEPESDYYMDAGGNPQRKEKADYFVEEIKANVIYHDKVFPLVGMIAGQVARGVGQAGKKVGGQLLQDIGDVSHGMMQQEEEEQ